MIRKLNRLLCCLLFLCLLAGCQKKLDDQNKTQAEHNESAAKINTQLGVIYLDKGEMQRAKQKFLLALKLGPDIPEPWYAMGYFLETTGNIKEAKVYYLKAIAINPDRGDSLNNYGTFLCRNGDYQEAVSYFLKAANNKSYLESAAAYENAGLCSLTYEHNKSALDYFEKALSQDANRPVSLLAAAELSYQFNHQTRSQALLNQYLSLASPNKRTEALLMKLHQVDQPKVEEEDEGEGEDADQ